MTTQMTTTHVPTSSAAPQTDSTPSTWLYVRIYCPPELNDIAIVQLIHPLVRELKAQGLIDRSFFIRYHEGGNHLRLRVHGRYDVLFGPVRRLLDHWIVAFFAAHGFTVDGPLDDGPNGVDDPSWEPKLPGSTPRPIPSYEYDRYEPEINRYGGPHGLALSETHFEQSSHLAAQVIERVLAGYGPRQNAALLLMDAMVEALGYMGTAKAETFARQCHYWLRSHWMQPHPARYLRWLSDEYTRLRRPVRQLLPTDRPADNSHPSRAPWKDLLDRWRTEMTTLSAEIAKLEAQGQLTESRASLLQSYIHMLCNRLGILPREEACLAHLVYRHYAEAWGMKTYDFLNLSMHETVRLMEPTMTPVQQEALRQALRASGVILTPAWRSPGTTPDAETALAQA